MLPSYEQWYIMILPRKTDSPTMSYPWNRKSSWPTFLGRDELLGGYLSPPSVAEVKDGIWTWCFLKHISRIFRANHLRLQGRVWKIEDYLSRVETTCIKNQACPCGNVKQHSWQHPLHQVKSTFPNITHPLKKIVPLNKNTFQNPFKNNLT